MQETLRTFVALILPPESMTFLANLQGILKSHHLKLSWVKQRNLHLTMKFLGDIQASELPAIVNALQSAAAGYSALHLILQGMGVFPGIKRPRVLWAGLEGDTDGLRALFGDLEAGLERLAISRDKRAFKAHITLGRIRKRVDAHVLRKAIEDVGCYASHPFVARRLVLFKSDLRPSGAVYSPLAEAVLD